MIIWRRIIIWNLLTVSTSRSATLSTRSARTRLPLAAGFAPIGPSSPTLLTSFHSNYRNSWLMGLSTLAWCQSISSLTISYIFWAIYTFVSFKLCHFHQTILHVVHQAKFTTLHNSISMFFQLFFVLEICWRPIWNCIPPSSRDLVH